MGRTISAPWRPEAPETWSSGSAGPAFVHPARAGRDDVSLRPGTDAASPRAHALAKSGGQPHRHRRWSGCPARCATHRKAHAKESWRCTLGARERARARSSTPGGRMWRAAFPTTISPAFPRTRTRALGAADGCPLFRGVPACQRQSGAGTGRALRAIPRRRREKVTPGTGHVDGLDVVKHVLVDTAVKCARTEDQRFQSPSSRAIDFRVFTLRRPAPIRAEGGLRR